MHETWPQWVHRITGDASTRVIAARVKRSHTTIQRWLRGRPSPEAVFRIALAYGVDPIDAFVAAEWMTDGEASMLRQRTDLRGLPTEVLTAELHRRVMQYRKHHPWHEL